MYEPKPFTCINNPTLFIAASSFAKEPVSSALQRFFTRGCTRIKEYSKRVHARSHPIHHCAYLYTKSIYTSYLTQIKYMLQCMISGIP